MEIWKDIKGFRELYQISNLGKIRRKDNNKILKPLKLTKGYNGVRLYYNTKKRQLQKRYTDLLLNILLKILLIYLKIIIKMEIKITIQLIILNGVLMITI